MLEDDHRHEVLSRVTVARMRFASTFERQPRNLRMAPGQPLAEALER